MLTLLLSNHCILSLVLNVMNQVENTVVCMARLLSSNAHTSSNFNSIHLKISTYIFLRCSFTPHDQNIKILKIDFYDIITSVLNCIQHIIFEQVLRSTAHISFFIGRATLILDALTFIVDDFFCRLKRVRCYSVIHIFQSIVLRERSC